MWAWSAIAAMGQQRCDPAVPVSEALVAVQAGDQARARSALDQVEGALACGPPASAETLATWWILDAALLERAGDRLGAEGSLASARRLAPQIWPEGLPEALRATWASLPSLEGQGSLQLTPPPSGREVWIDGQARTSLEVGAGLHTIQVGDAEGRAVFAETVWVDAGVTSVLSTALHPLAVPPALPPSRTRVFGVALWVGLDAARGQALQVRADGTDWREPATRLSVPIEGSATLDATGWLWVRAYLGAGPLLGGRLLYQRATDDRVMGIPLHLDGGAGVGLQRGEIRLGLLGGAQWPARLAGRAVVGWSPGSGPWTGELRVGGNLATSGRSPEPAAQLAVGFQVR